MELLNPKSNPSADGQNLKSEAANTSSGRNALVAAFLGWMLDAFDFFILTFVLGAVAKDFHVTVPAVAFTLTASLATRPIGAFVFGLMSDRWGRRVPLMLDILFYSLMEVLSGLAPSYRTFFTLRLLYGVGMGGEWGVGASLAMESVPVKWRGFCSGFLQEGYAAGNLCAAGAYFLVYPRWGWRPMFFVGAIPALITLFILTKVREPEAWTQSRTDWRGYVRAIFQNGRLFLYLVVLMTMMNFISHGTQDLYPTFLQRQRHFTFGVVALITAISTVGAICGGLLFGFASDRLGRRRAMLTAVLLGIVLIPIWILAPWAPLIAGGAFLMQFMVQGAWGVVPAHINELSPPQLRGFFPGFAYQLGVLCASSISYVEAVLGEHFSYAQSMGFLAAAVLLIGAIVIRSGPEATGVEFSR